MNHLLDPLNYLFGYDLGNPIEDGKKAQEQYKKPFISQQTFANAMNEELNRLRFEKLKVGDTVTFERPPSFGNPFKIIDGECTVIDIDGKKLLEDNS